MENNTKEVEVPLECSYKTTQIQGHSGRTVLSSKIIIVFTILFLVLFPVGAVENLDKFNGNILKEDSTRRLHANNQNIPPKKRQLWGKESEESIPQGSNVNIQLNTGWTTRRKQMNRRNKRTRRNYRLLGKKKTSSSSSDDKKNRKKSGGKKSSKKSSFSTRAPAPPATTPAPPPATTPAPPPATTPAPPPATTPAPPPATTPAPPATTPAPPATTPAPPATTPAPPATTVAPAPPATTPPSSQNCDGNCICEDKSSGLDNGSTRRLQSKGGGGADCTVAPPDCNIDSAWSSYSVTFLSRYYDGISTTFSWEIESPMSQSISHVTFGWLGECCITNFGYEGIADNDIVCGLDPTTCLKGIKDDKNYEEGPNPRTETMTLVGNIPIGQIPIAIKAANGFCVGTYQGPDCTSCQYSSG